MTRKTKTLRAQDCKSDANRIRKFRKFRINICIIVAQENYFITFSKVTKQKHVSKNEK